MSVINNSLLLTAPAGGAYQVSRSLRFNAPDSSFLSRTPGSAGNRKTWTWAGWVKRSAISSAVIQTIFGVYSSGGATYHNLNFGTGNNFVIYDTNGVTTFVTTQVFRDPSAWLHVVVARDTTQATASNRVKLYVNGTQVTTFDSTSYPAQNSDGEINSTVQHNIGSSLPFEGRYFSGYLAEVHFIDGQALDPSSFTETDATTGQLIPKAYTGSYGSNGWKLSFSDNSTAAALGTDTSGNNNNWTPNNFIVSSANIVSYTATNTSDAFNAFDGNLSTYWLPNANSSSLLTFATPVTGTSFRLYMGASLNTTNFQINGSAPSGFSGSKNPDWYDFSSHIGGTLSSIQLSYVPAQYSQYVYAIEVDGAILYDNRRAAANDSLVDTPTSYGTDTGVGGEVRGNYATWNPLAILGTTSTINNGNLTFPGGTNCGNTSTIGMASGKWYWEIVYASTGGNQLYLGITNVTNSSDRVAGLCGIRDSGALYNGNGATTNGSGTTALVGNDIVNFAYDADNKKLFIGKNNTWFNSANPAAGTNATYTNVQGSVVFAAISENSSSTTHANFGQRAWVYTAPSGFKALCDTNLPAPAISKPGTVMDVKLYTGNGSTQTISGLGFSPDLVWIKCRTASVYHALFDAVRGVHKRLGSNETSAEQNQSPSGLSAFTSDGFTVIDGDTGGNGVNGQPGGLYAGAAAQYVAWAWDAGTSTVTNTSGTISAQVRANASAGFSVVTWTGTGASASIGHGLGVAPTFAIIKRRDSAQDWYVTTTVISGLLDYLALNKTDASAWTGVSVPSSTVFNLGTGASNNASGATYVGYFFAPVSGYSSFGSYTGNGSADGPFVYTGFRPRWIMLKNASSSGGGGNHWLIWDSLRNTYNVTNTVLFPNLSNADVTASSVDIDILSNGFKIKAVNTGTNGSAESLIYACFAESPFQYARAR